MSKFVISRLFPQICPRCLQTYRKVKWDSVIQRSATYRQYSQHNSSVPPDSDHTTGGTDADPVQSTQPDDRATPRYPGHIHTTRLQRALLSVGSAAAAITSPWRGDMVATLGETTGHYTLVQMRQKMLQDEVGRQILEERPRINTCTVDLHYLRSLPDDTFGKTYVNWLDKNRASPDERLPVHFVDDPSLAYVMTRYRETHDLYHTVLGMPTNMLGEVVVKWVEAIQLGLPMCGLGALAGPVRLGPKHLELYLRSHLWWAISTGRRATFLLNVYYEKHWEKTLGEVRGIMNVPEPPVTPSRRDV